MISDSVPSPKLNHRAFAQRWLRPLPLQDSARRHCRVAFSGSVLLMSFFILSASVLRADVVVLRTQSRPLVGRVLDRDAERLVVAIPDAEGITREQVVPIDDVLLVVPAEDTDKLGALQPGTWEAYRQLAEELASQRIDPEAVDLAIRLFLIVAFHEPGDVRESCLASLVSLARSPEEERRFRSLAFRFSEQDRLDWLQPPANTVRTPLTDRDREMLLRTVRLVRQDDGDQALAIMREDGFTTIYLQVEHLLPFRDLKRYAYDRSSSPRKLADLVRFELALLERTFGNQTEEEVVIGSTGWSSLGLEQVPPLHDVDWLNACEFDPRDHLYRDGSWRRP